MKKPDDSSHFTLKWKGINQRCALKSAAFENILQSTALYVFEENLV